MFKIEKILAKFKKKKQRGDINFQSGWALGGSALSTNVYWNNDSPSNRKINDKRKAKKSVEIFNEIIGEEPIMDLTDVDGQIASVKERIRLLDAHLGEDRMGNDEESALAFLEARKKYKENAPRFQWAVTTQELVDTLCNKYKVRLVSFDGYYKNVPNEGLVEAENFLKAYKKVRKDEPCFKLIVDEGGPETKKDPILLAGSPFGNWFYLLGAWDKEVEIVDKLIYATSITKKKAKAKKKVK